MANVHLKNNQSNSYNCQNLPASVIDPSPSSSTNNVCSTKLTIPPTEQSGVFITALELDGGGLGTGVA